MNSKAITAAALLSAASAVALIAAAPALAQTATASAAAKSGDDGAVIIVSGQRRALQSAQQRKKTADQIVDSITAVDIGALPDRSVTEALQRVPGVAIGRTNQPRDIDRLNVEGSGVIIRGLNWVRSEINGRDSFGAANGRSLGWEDVTPELAAGVDVYKNPSAEIVEGGLGGTINLRTWMPFDNKGDKLAFAADDTYGDLRKKWTPSASVLLSKRIDTGIGEMGFLVDVARSQLDSRLNALEVDPYDAHSASTNTSYDGGTTVTNYSNAIPGTTGTTMVPTGIEYRLEDRDKTRDGLYGAFQWKPNDNTEYYATYFLSKSRLISEDHFAQTSACCSASNNQNFLNGPAAGTTFTFDSNRNFLKGTITDGQGGGNGVPNSFLLNLGTRYANETAQTGDFSTGVKWRGDKWSFNVDFQHIDADHKDYDMTVYNTVTATGGIGLDVTGDLPVITMSDLTATPNVFNLYAAMDHDEIDKARQNTIKLDGEYDFDDGFFKSFKFGYRGTDRVSIVRDSGYNWNLISAPWAFDTQTATVGSFPQNQEIVSFGNFFGGSVKNPPSLWMPTMNLAQSTAATSAYLQQVWFAPNFGKNLVAYDANSYGMYCATCGNGTVPWGPNAGAYSPFANGSLAGYIPIWASARTSPTPSTDISFWQPFNGNYNFVPTSTSGLGTNTQRETTQALYGMVRFASDKLFGYGLNWDGNFGLRVVGTSSTSEGIGHIAQLTPASNVSSMSAAALQALLFADGSNHQVKYKNRYINVLPSLNLRFKPTDDQFVRFAVASSIVRPQFYQLQPSFQMSGSFQTRLARGTDNVINTLTGTPYTQAQLDAIDRSTCQIGVADPINGVTPDTCAPVQYNTGAAFSFTAGNPNLKPMKAISYDLDYEWYIKPGSMLAFGLFDKELYNYIQSDQASVQISNNGVTQTIVGNIPQNHGHGQIHGAEFQVTYFYDFLPGAFSGLGTDFNVTVLETRGTQNTSSSVYDPVQTGAARLKLPLEQLSRYAYNATLMYNKYGFDARLAYNWRSRYLMAASASNVQAPAYMEDYGQLDASLMYTLNDHYKIGIQAVNLTGAKSIIDIDERDNWYYGTQGNFNNSLVYKHNWTLSDKRISLVLRGTF
jgi:TonB-dependent receptor